jgi:3-(3-hydroxy-phenyl)propionate hydroxylase
VAAPDTRAGDGNPVVIVGAGPTGLVAATLLAQYGVRVVLLERHPQPYPLPRAVHLDDEVLRILQQVGVAEEFAAISRPAAGLRLLDARHRVIAEFRRDTAGGMHGHPQANLFDQPDLERLLRRNLARYPQIELRTGVEVTGVTHVAAGLRVDFRAAAAPAAPDGGSLTASAVLGCDGAGSTVRALIGSALEDLGFEERWLVVDVRCEVQLPVWDGVEQVCDPRRAATFMQIGPDRYRWEFRLRADESAASLTSEDRLRALIAPWLGEHPPFQLERCAEYTFRARLADRWRSGRIFLLGDAAHLTPPFIGQGLGSGLRDAANLTWKLARVLTGDADERLLDTYQAERKPHARALIRLAVLAGWAMTGGQDRAATLRRVLLRVVCRVPGVTGLILDSTSPRLVAGPLVRRLPVRSRIRPFTAAPRLARGLRRPVVRDLAGTLCPQPWVVADGIRRRLDDVLGPGFAVLVDGPPDAALLTLAERLRARVILLSPPGLDGTAIDAPRLRDWLSGGGVRAVLLRPDRVVLTSWPDGDPESAPIGARHLTALLGASRPSARYGG